MTKRFVSSIVVALSLCALLFVATAVFSADSTQASTAAAAQDKAQGAEKGKEKVEQAQGTWSDVSPFPTISVTEFYPCNPQPCTPTGVNVSARIKRAGATGYHPNGKLYMLGGRHGLDGQEDYPLRWIWEYDPAADTWLRKNALLEGQQSRDRFIANMAVATLTDTTGVRVYAIGGSNVDSVPSDLVRSYDPIADSITQLSGDAWPANPPRIPGGSAVYDNKLYIFGGFSALTGGGQGSVFTDTWRFDPMAPTGSKWTQMDAMNLGRAYIGGAAVNGRLYAVGGDTWDPVGRVLVPSANVEMLDLTQPSPTWVNVAPLPAARGDLGAWGYDSSAPYEIAGKVLAAGGPYPVPSDSAYLYDPGTNTWTTAPAMAHATRNFARAQLNGYLYAFGGYDYTNNTPNGANWNQRYDATSGGTPTPTVTGIVPTNTPTNTPPIATLTNTSTPTIIATSTPCSFATIINEGFETPPLGVFTSTVAICLPGGCNWVRSTTAPVHGGTYQAFAPDLDDITDQYLTNITSITIPAGSQSAELTFWHRYDLEDTYDGGVLETSTNGGTSWQDAGALITVGDYNMVISEDFQSPIAGREAWSGLQATYTQVRVNLSSFIGQTDFKIRFREANDNSVSAVGWFVDDVVISTTGGCPTPPTATATATTAPSNTPTVTVTSEASVTVEPTVTACTLEFTDVPNTNTFYPFVRCLACQGIINGYPCGSTGEPCDGNNNPYFRPNNPVTRGQIAKMVTLSANFNEPIPTTQQTFEDAPYGSTFWEFIERLSDRSIVGGYQCGINPAEPCVPPENRPYFRPNAGATRGQLVKIASESAGFNDTIPETQYTFTDVEPGHTFWVYIERLLLNRPDAIAGYPCGGPGEPCDSENRPYFRPNNGVTRGQASKIISNTFFPGCNPPQR